jgi:hypothetical protein
MLKKIKKNKILVGLGVLILVITVYLLLDIKKIDEKYEIHSKVEVFGNNGLHIITLGSDAVLRLGIKTFEIGEDDIEDYIIEYLLKKDEDEDEDGDGEGSMVIPYSSIIYDENGKT